MREITLRAKPLRASDFAPFGEVIDTDGRESRWINDGTCRRFDGLADIDVLAAEGRPLLSIFEASPRALPLRIHALERHPLSSQAFFPLEAYPFLVVVADDGPAPLAERLRAFHSSGRQGVNYRRNIWHHPLIALDRLSRFLVIDRGGAGENCDVLAVDGDGVFVDAPVDTQGGA
jgi:ureidoglycolate lyase